MRWFVLLALLAACHRHESQDHDNAGSATVGSASVVSGSATDSPLPKLPISEDGGAEVAAIEIGLAHHRDKPGDVMTTLGLLGEREAAHGQLEDYQAALATAIAWTERDPKSEPAWTARINALSTVHRFAEARALALAHLSAGDSRDGILALLGEATGDVAGGLAYRAKLAAAWPKQDNVAAYGAALAAAGKLDEALVQMKRASTDVRNNAPAALAWLLWQYGRVYELRGELATARTFYEASRARMPTLEPTLHLIQVLRATGDTTGADALAKAALAAAPGDPNPDLLAAAGRVDAARAAWERYVAALPEAFADHAARFYLATAPASPADARRALDLARANLANRDTDEAHALVVEAALAASDPTTACAAAPKLADDPYALRAHRFLAWKAFSACHDAARAAQLARALGIALP